MNTTNAMHYRAAADTKNPRYFVAAIISLDDKCGNGHEDFSLTGELIDRKAKGRDRVVSCGCIHDEILAAMPELAPFAALHLSDWKGAPSHAAANAFYWYAGTKPDNLGQEYTGATGRDGKTPEKCREIFKNHIRATDEDLAKIDAANPRTQTELAAVLEDLDFPKRWKAEADAAIATLEGWTNQKFESKATRSQWTPPTEEQRAEIEHRRRTGYYEPEQVAARAAAEKRAKREQRLKKLHEDHARALEKATNKLRVAVYFASRDIDAANVIYYDHTNEITVNWNTFARRWTREEFAALVASADLSQLPQGVKFSFEEAGR